MIGCPPCHVAMQEGTEGEKNIQPSLTKPESIRLVSWAWHHRECWCCADRSRSSPTFGHERARSCRQREHRLLEHSLWQVDVSLLTPNSWFYTMSMSSALFSLSVSAWSLVRTKALSGYIVLCAADERPAKKSSGGPSVFTTAYHFAQ